MLAGDRTAICGAAVGWTSFKLSAAARRDDLGADDSQANSAFDTKMSVYEHRLASKDWAAAMVLGLSFFDGQCLLTLTPQEALGSGDSALIYSPLFGPS